MVAVTAGSPAGGPVLPEGIIRHSDLITVTEPTKGLDNFGASDGLSLYFCMLILNPEGRVIAERQGYLGLPEIERLNSYAQAIHVFRTGGALSDCIFFYDEVLESLEENPWVGKRWFNDNFLRWAELLPRPSETMPGLISYFQSPEKRARNIRTPIKPGRFLKKYFGDILSETQIHELALDWSNEFDLSKVKITQDADTIEQVYRGGPSSCMSKSFSGRPHPARVYAGPDLGLAYLGPADDATARAVVWPAKKVYGSPYGDTSRLIAALEDAGFTRGYTSAFEGARLRRIEWDDEIVLPYLDIADSADDRGSFIVIGEGGYLDTESTSGLAEPDQTCDDCESAMSDDSSNYICSAERNVCDRCYNRNYFFCEGLNESYPDDERADTTHGIYSKDYVEKSTEWFLCAQSDQWHCISDTYPVDTYEGDTIALCVAEEQGFFCEKLGLWTLEIDYRVRLTNGKSLHMDAFDSEAALNEWLLEHGAIVGDPEQIDPNQLPLPLSEAA